MRYSCIDRTFGPVPDTFKRVLGGISNEFFFPNGEQRRNVKQAMQSRSPLGRLARRLNYVYS